MVTVDEEQSVLAGIRVAGDAGGNSLAGQEAGVANGKDEKVARRDADHSPIGGRPRRSRGDILNEVILSQAILSLPPAYLISFTFPS